jgi:hypothetical protein
MGAITALSKTTGKGRKSGGTRERIQCLSKGHLPKAQQMGEKVKH